MSKRLLSLLLLVVLLSPSITPYSAAQEAAVTSPRSFRSSSVMFIENVGQFAEDARFQVRGGDSTIWLADDAIWITVVERTSPPTPPLRGEGSSERPTPPSLAGIAKHSHQGEGVGRVSTLPIRFLYNEQGFSCHELHELNEGAGANSGNS